MQISAIGSAASASQASATTRVASQAPPAAGASRTRPQDSVQISAAGAQATQAGNSNYAAATPVSVSFTVTAGSQTIAFGALSGQAFGAAPFAVSATATSAARLRWT